MRASLLAILVAGVAIGEASQVTPVQKVIGMLGDMLAKGEKEKHEEQVSFATYKQFCESTAAEKARNIVSGKEALVQLHADGEKASADVLVLTKEIAGLGGEIDSQSAEKAEAVEIRTKEHADYEVIHADYSNAMDAVERALNVLKSSPGQSFAQVSEALVQLQSFVNRVSSADSEALIQLGQNPKTFESSSGGIIDMVKKLGDKFKAERYTLEQEESKKQHSSDMIVQDLTDAIERATMQSDEKISTKKQRENDAAEAKGDHADTTVTLAEDTKFSGDLASECNTKSVDFEKSQELRAGEIVAVNKAIEIMSGDAVSGGTQHLPSLVQDATALAQLRADQRSPLQGRVASFLNARASRTNSRVLSLIAIKVSDDPLSKVKKMIVDMVTKLMEEANEEAEHKGWCDTELSTNEQTRKEKTEAVETLHAEIDQLQASIAKLTDDISDLTKGIAELDAAMAKATSLRTEEKAKNTETISDAGEAQTAVAQALTVLKEFYARAAESTAFVQQKAEPEIFDSAYKGMGGESGGVVGMLEVIESDFARLESDTKASEATAQKEFDEFMTDSKVDKAEKTTDSEHKAAKKQDESQALTTKGNDLEGTQKELDAALAYFDKLKPSCVDAGVSFEDRVGRRKEEIESLQEALKILNGEDIA